MDSDWQMKCQKVLNKSDKNLKIPVRLEDLVAYNGIGERGETSTTIGGKCSSQEDHRIRGREKERFRFGVSAV